MYLADAAAAPVRPQAHYGGRPPRRAATLALLRPCTTVTVTVSTPSRGIIRNPRSTTQIHPSLQLSYQEFQQLNQRVREINHTLQDVNEDVNTLNHNFSHFMTHFPDFYQQYPH